MSIPTLTTAPVAATAPRPSAYATGLTDGRTCAATTTADIIAVRNDWITEYAGPDYADGYTHGLTFDRDLQPLTGRR